MNRKNRICGIPGYEGLEMLGEFFPVSDPSVDSRREGNDGWGDGETSQNSEWGMGDCGTERSSFNDMR
jgi:hypothetical protein